MGRKVKTIELIIAVSLLALFVIAFFCPRNAAANNIVKIAQSQIGKGEIGGDNRGETVKEYTRGKEVAWCAAFVSWVRFRAGQSDNYFLSAKSYWNTYRNKRVSRPKSGDIIVFERGGRKGHVGIVEKVQGKTIVAIEGNVGDFPAKVKRIKYNLNHIPNLLGFIRI